MASGSPSGASSTESPPRRRVGADGEPRVSRSDRRVARRLALAFFVFYAGFAPSNFKTSDEWSVFEATAALWEVGRPSVLPASHTSIGRAGHLYSQYGLGQSVLALPYFLSGRLLGSVLPESWARRFAGPRVPEVGPPRQGGTPEIAMTTLFAPTVLALLLATFFSLQRALGVSARRAVVVTILLGTTTYVGAHAVYFLRHGTTTLLFLAVVLALHRYGRTGKVRSLFAACAMAVLIPLVRLPDAVLGLPLGIYLAWNVHLVHEREGRASLVRAAPALLGPATLGLVAFMASNWVRWGTFFDRPILSYASSFDTPLREGLFGFLLSPGSSVFLYSPPLLLAPFACAALARRERALFWLCTGTSLGLLLFYSKWSFWAGMPTAPGPRYLFAIVPLMLLGLGPWFESLRSRGAWWAVCALACAGAGVQLLLLLANWLRVIMLIGVERTPPWNFLYDPARSPIVGAVEALSIGSFNPWIIWQARGWPGVPADPALAGWLGLGWGLGVAACALGVRRALSEQEGAEARESQTAAR